MTILLDRCAYHFVDKHASILRCSIVEQDLSRVNPAICQFFQDLTTDFWTAEDSGSTVSGRFAVEGSDLGSSQAHPLIQQIFADPTCFFANSVALADLLYTCSPTNASPGVLVLLLCLDSETGRRVLAIYKLRYRDESIIRFLDGESVPQIEVDQIRNMLLKELQKGALVPHPDRQEYDLKLTDRQGDEPAAYFKEKFLGCTTKKSDEHQIHRLIPELALYARASGLSLDPQRIPAVFLDLRGSAGSITADVLAAAVERSELFGPRFSRPDFIAYLQRSDHLKDLNIPSAAFLTTKTADRKLVFKFTHGPLDGVSLTASPESLTGIITVDGDTVTFTIRTTLAGYQCSYE